MYIIIHLRFIKQQMTKLSPLSWIVTFIRFNRNKDNYEYKVLLTQLLAIALYSEDCSAKREIQIKVLNKRVLEYCY